MRSTAEITFPHSLGTSKLERYLFLQFEQLLEQKGYRYLSLPAAIRAETVRRQEVALPGGKILTPEACFQLSPGFVLSGSAEQGILEHHADRYVPPRKLYALTQCFRNEPVLEPPIRCYEFKKLEQFVFCESEEGAMWAFEDLLGNALGFLRRFEVPHQVVDVTERDPGYQKRKYDIEIWSEAYGWVETHSCTYFGEEQSRRFGISGATHTVSNTGIASPRILIPFLEGNAVWPLPKEEER